jgi:hypothetical protein
MNIDIEYKNIIQIVMNNDTESLKHMFENEDVKNKYFKNKIMFEICAQWGRLVSLKCFVEEIYKDCSIQDIITTRTLFECINGDITYCNFLRMLDSASLSRPREVGYQEYIDARLSHQSCLPYIMYKLNIKIPEDISINSSAFIFHYNLLNSAIQEKDKCLLIKQEIKHTLEKIKDFHFDLIDVINNYIL